MNSVTREELEEVVDVFVRGSNEYLQHINSQIGKRALNKALFPFNIFIIRIARRLLF